VACLTFAWELVVRCAHNAREVRLSKQCTRDKRGVRSRFEEGTRPSKDGTNLLSDLPGPAGTLLRKHEPARLVSPYRPREGAARGEGSRRASRLSLQHEEAMQLVVGARASSYCRSRKDALGLREA